MARQTPEGRSYVAALGISLLPVLAEWLELHVAPRPRMRLWKRFLCCSEHHWAPNETLLGLQCFRTLLILLNASAVDTLHDELPVLTHRDARLYHNSVSIVIL